MSIAQRLYDLKNELPEGVKLVAVSKFQTVETILEAYNAGQRVFGENRPQELQKKVGLLPEDIEWHFIGHLQTNKLKMVFPYTSLVHSIDSQKLLLEADKFCIKSGIKREILLQLYVAQEETKYGFSSQELIGLLDSIESGELTLKSLTIRGLMGMASFVDDEDQIRREFQQILDCNREVKQRNYSFLTQFDQLSFGMSSDYGIATEMGATIIRIGTKIFQ